jgi:hypothetical protein
LNAEIVGQLTESSSAQEMAVSLISAFQREVRNNFSSGLSSGVNVQLNDIRSLYGISSAPSINVATIGTAATEISDSRYHRNRVIQKIIRHNAL